MGKRIKKAKKFFKKVQVTARKYERKVPSTTKLIGGVGGLGTVNLEDAFFGKKKKKQKRWP